MEATRQPLCDDAQCVSTPTEVISESESASGDACEAITGLESPFDFLPFELLHEIAGKAKYAYNALKRSYPRFARSVTEQDNKRYAKRFWFIRYNPPAIIAVGGPWIKLTIREIMGYDLEPTFLRAPAHEGTRPPTNIRELLEYDTVIADEPAPGWI